MTGLAWYLAETAAALAVFYAVYRLFLKDETHFQLSRLYLLATLAGAHLLPLAHVTLPFRQVVVARLPIRAVDDFARSGGASDWRSLLLWVYAAGAVFVCLRLGWHLRNLRLVARQHPVEHRDGVRLVYLEEDCQPFSFFRTAFVHRPRVGSEGVFDQVVAHELAHIRQGHSLDLLVVQVAAIGQWFNPFIWLYQAGLRELHEYLADRGVLEQGFDPLAYRQILLEQRLGARSLELAHHLRQSEIRRRLAMMTRRSGSWTICRYFLALPAVALLVVAFADPQVTVAQDAAKIEGATVVPAPPASAAARPNSLTPGVIEELLRKVSRETATVEAKRREVTEPAKKAELQKELADLAKKRAFLTAKLSQLERGE